MPLMGHWWRKGDKVCRKPVSVFSLTRTMFCWIFEIWTHFLQLHTVSLPAPQLFSLVKWISDHKHGEKSLLAAALTNTHSVTDSRKLSLACSHWAVCGELSKAICVCDRPCSLPPANLAASIYRSNRISSLAHAHWLSVSQGSERKSFQEFDA